MDHDKIKINDVINDPKVQKLLKACEDLKFHLEEAQKAVLIIQNLE